VRGMDLAEYGQGIVMLTRNYAGPWKCPVCEFPLDNQGYTDTSTQGNRRERFDLFCHRCLSHFVFAVRRHTPPLPLPQETPHVH